LDKFVTHIALLRGINVGGHRPLKMTRLQEMFAAMGFENISTYIQSGNVIFDAPSQKEQSLSAQIADQIAVTFDYNIPVKAILKKFPFAEREGWKSYITFLASQPPENHIAKLETLSTDIEHFKGGERAVYIQVNKQTDKKARFSNRFIQQQLDTSATNRNLKSVRKLVQLLSANS
jgi:uncharacterized protein (DUF1697 family)